MIVGIDPGTTVGWAVLDIDGNFVAVGSRRNFDLDSIVATLVPHGKVLIVGSDKFKLPSLVHEVATKMGAKAVFPSQDLRVDEKRFMTEKFSFNNSHEMDALACAVFACKKIQPLVKRVRSSLTRRNRLDVFEGVLELVLKEEISIHAALAILTPEPTIVVSEEVEEQKKDGDIVRLYSSLARTRRDNAVLFNKNLSFASRITNLEKELSSLKKKASRLVKPKSESVINELKEKQIKSISKSLDKTSKKLTHMKKLNVSLGRLLLRRDLVPLARLSHLGWDEVMRFSDVIYEGSVLFVDNVNQISMKAVDFLQNKKVQLIVCGELPGKGASLRLPFACVKAERHELMDNLVFVGKAWLDSVRSDRLVLSKLVEEYRKSRSSSFQ